MRTFCPLSGRSFVSHAAPETKRTTWGGGNGERTGAYNRGIGEATKMKKILEEIRAYVSFTLLLLGIGGVAWGTFREGGWIHQFVGHIWSSESHDVMMTGTIVVATVALSVFFLRAGVKITGKGHPFGEAIVYAVMAYGAYIAYVWLF